MHIAAVLEQHLKTLRAKQTKVQLMQIKRLRDAGNVGEKAASVDRVIVLTLIRSL
jgi:hypothetical protein